MVTLSPFAPDQFPTLPIIAGLKLGVTACGLCYQGRDDLVALRIEVKNSSIAAVFTTNKLPGEPVKWCKKHLPTPPQHLVMAAGNANVFTGAAGWQVLEDVAEDIAKREKITSNAVYFAMTGVIGEIFLATPLLNGLAELQYAVPNPALWQRAASAIMTTDTFAKGTAQTAKVAENSVQIAGIAKGSGMIAPDMATMLAFLFTDAAIPHDLLQQMLHAAMPESFHGISVDSDTSTSDSVMLIATGTSDCLVAKTYDDPLYDDFRTALQRACQDLAYQVVTDGEGIAKLLDIRLTGAKDSAEARCAALSIANSPLVKTAINGADANWGRVVMAIGKARVALEPEQIQICFGGHVLAEGGGAMAYDIAAVNKHLAGRKVTIAVNLGVGNASAQVYGNDLSHDYIRINADYRS